MKFEEVSAIVGDTPYVSKKNGRFLYDLIIENKLANILELGIGHGTATCYMAAALHELGEGSIRSVDLIEVKDWFKPSAEEQLEKIGLSGLASIIRTQTGYAWFLHDEIARNTRNNYCEKVYDLCVVDGPKNWTIDGASFFFVDKLLKKDGYIIFDDYNWTYAAAAERGSVITDGVTHHRLSKEELETPHIREIFELLVKQHPDYGHFISLDEGDWVIAQKTMTSEKACHFIYRETTKDLFAKIVLKTYKRLRSLRKK